jgi:hypothetical protein
MVKLIGNLAILVAGLALMMGMLIGISVIFLAATIIVVLGRMSPPRANGTQLHLSS